MSIFQPNVYTTNFGELPQSLVKKVEKLSLQKMHKYPISLLMPGLIKHIIIGKKPLVIGKGNFQFKLEITKLTPPMANINQVSKGIKCLDERVLGVDGANKEQFETAKRLIGPNSRTRFLWHDSPEMQEIKHDLINKEGYNLEDPGKGRNVFFMLVDLYGRKEKKQNAVFLHDIDIKPHIYTPRFVFNALHAYYTYPYADLYKLAVKRKKQNKKGNYELTGRATRLFFVPLMESLYLTPLRLKKAELNLRDHMMVFLYGLGGDVIFGKHYRKDIELPYDWSIEVKTLMDALEKIVVQVFVGDYDHDHQPLSPDDPSKGIFKMEIDVGKAVIRDEITDSRGNVTEKEKAKFEQIKKNYIERAKIAIDKAERISAFEFLDYDRAAEEEIVETGIKALDLALEAVEANPKALISLPSPRNVPEKYAGAIVTANDIYN